VLRLIETIFAVDYIILHFLTILANDSQMGNCDKLYHLMSLRKNNTYI